MHICCSWTVTLENIKDVIFKHLPEQFQCQKTAENYLITLLTAQVITLCRMSHSMGYSGHGSRLQIKGGERACSRFCRVKRHYIKSSISICGPGSTGEGSFCDLWSLLLRENKNCSHPCWAVQCSICEAQLCLDNNTHQMVITQTAPDPNLVKRH